MANSATQPEAAHTSRFDALLHAAPYLCSVAALPGLGSCFLFTQPTLKTAALITTSAALDSRRTATVTPAIFCEDPPLAHQLGVKPVRTVVSLRPDRLFFCSSGPAGAETEEGSSSIGYTVVACDTKPGGDRSQSILVDSGPPASRTPGIPVPMSSLRDLRPLPLPLLFSRLPPVRVGDSHMIVAHTNGGSQRRQYACTVTAVHEHHCEYSELDPSSDFATGGPVFAQNGSLIAIHHQQGPSNIGLFTCDIIRHLYEARLLGRCGVPIDTAPPEQTHSNFGLLRYGDNVAELRCKLARPLVSDEMSASSAAAVIRATASHIVPLGDWETQRRMARPARGPLAVPTHIDVWDEYFEPNNYESLVRMLYAFHTHPPLLELIVRAMISKENRCHLPDLTRLGSIGILLEALDALPYGETLATAGLTLLGHASLYDENREALAQYAGVPTVLAMLLLYRNCPMATPWACYTLSNLCEGDSAVAASNAATVLDHGGLELIIGVTLANVDGRHGARWGGLAVANVLEAPASTMEDWVCVHEEAVRHGAVRFVTDGFAAHADDSFALLGPARVLQALTKGAGTSPVTSAALVAAGITPHIAAALRQSHDDFVDVARHCVGALAGLLVDPVDPAATTAAVEAAQESRLLEAVHTTVSVHRADGSLRKEAAAFVFLLDTQGVAVPSQLKAELGDEPTR